MPDKITIHDLALSVRVGCTAEERRLPQPILLDVEMVCDIRRAAKADSINHSLDYALVCRDLKEKLEPTVYVTIERMAEESAALVLKGFRTSEVFVRIKKRALPGIDYATVEITRKKR